VQAAVRNAGAVINCIAGSEQTMVRATETLCAAKPARIVHLSSMAVYGAATGIVREDSPPVAPLSGYGQAKLDCEARVQSYVDGGGQAVILRPTCVFGPGSRQWTTRIARLLQARRLGDLGAAGDGCCNLAFIDDVVQAILGGLEAPSGIFNVNSAADLTWNQFLLRFAKALGATPVRRVPGRMLRLETRLLAPARRVAAKLIDTPATEAITPSLAALFRQDIRVDASAAIAELGVRPTGMDRMIGAAVQWLQQAAGKSQARASGHAPSFGHGRG
jgi:nucleoside-diphosphate-sugar epimerase